MKIHHLTVEEAFAGLQSRPDGLSTKEAGRRLAEFGMNEIEPVQGESPARKFLKGFTHFFALILWAAAGLAFFAELREPGQGMVGLGWAIIGVIVINGAFSFWQEHRAEKALAALQKLLPHQVKLRREGRMIFVLHRGGWSYGQTLAPRNPLYLQATTACLSAIVVMQVVNVFLCSSRRESVFAFRLLSNPLILLGILIELTIILLIDYTPWGNAVFGTAPIPLTVRLFVIPFALGMLSLEEARKRLVRAEGFKLNRHTKVSDQLGDRIST